MTYSIRQAQPEHLPAIINLWGPNRKSLGFFPEGAFEDHVARGWTLVAIDDAAGVAGYLIYRISRGRATLTHVCVDTATRNQGVAKQLVEAAIQRTAHTNGVLIKCRREYDANKLWRRCGFIPLNEVAGRGNDGGRLICWWFNHRPGLFDIAAEDLQNTGQLAVLDCNVYIDSQEGNEESDMLFSGWLEDEVTFCLTSEIYSELQRQEEDPKKRQRRIAGASTFRQVDPSSVEVEAVKMALSTILQRTATASNTSDFNQVVLAAAAGATYFVTREQWLQARADAIREAVGLSVVSPGELVDRVNQQIDGKAYEPRRLAGTPLQSRRLTSSDVAGAWTLFRNSGLGERKMNFRPILENALGHPEAFDAKVIVADGAITALIIYTRSESGVLTIPMLRVARGPLADTLSQHLVYDTIQYANQMRDTLIRFQDPMAPNRVLSAIEQAQFIPVERGYERLVLRGACNINEVPELATQQVTKPDNERYRMMLSRQITRLQAGTEAVQDFAASLWPLRIREAFKDYYIIPIRPKWAAELFDQVLADQKLFGADTRLTLSHENVYYKSPHPMRNMSTPGGILWYVSSDGPNHDVKAIRASSVLIETQIDHPKPIFKRFERFGVYSWADVSDLVNADLNSEVMALRFSGTENFVQPMPFHKIQELLFRHTGKKQQLQSPLKISESCYEEIMHYCTGSPLHAKSSDTAVDQARLRTSNNGR